MPARLKIATAALVLLLARATAAADPAPGPQHVETVEVRLLCVPPAPAAKCIELLPGHFVDVATWGKLDTAIKIAQDRVTRLSAENVSLRASANGWQPGWKLLAGAVLSGVGLGWYVHGRL